MDGKAIAVIGGGVAGLTAASVLQSAGYRVAVYEREAAAGGRALTDLLDGYRIDTGAQLIGAMYRQTLELARELGLGDRLRRVAGLDALYRQGRIHEVIYGSVASMARSGGLSFATKARLATRYVPFLLRHAADLDVSAPERASLAGLDGESIAEWAMREMDRGFLHSLAAPQLGAYYGSTAEETSAGFYHILARHGMDLTLYALAGGIGGVAERLATRLRDSGGELHLHTEVHAIECATEGVRITTGAGSATFAGAIGALPAPALLPIVRELPDSLGRWLAHVRFRPAVTLALLLDRPAGVRFFGLSFARGEVRNTGALCIQENKDPSLVPGGRGLLVAIAAPEATPGLIDLDSRQILERMLPEIEIALPGIGRRIARARVYRWKEGMPTFYPGYLRHLEEFRRLPASAVPFEVAGDYLYGPSLEGAVLSGRRAAARIRHRFG